MESSPTALHVRWTNRLSVKLTAVVALATTVTVSSSRTQPERALAS